LLLNDGAMPRDPRNNAPSVRCVSPTTPCLTETQDFLNVSPPNVQRRTTAVDKRNAFLRHDFAHTLLSTFCAFDTAHKLQARILQLA
jgi:hypothetical protein